MNHRPFEDWLLDDQPLTSQQERDLHAHLRSCAACATIAESNLALHTTRMVAVPVGFTDRFHVRLLNWRSQQRWRQIAGTLVLVLGGLAILYWLAGPTIGQVMHSPAAWITAAARYLVYGLTSFRVLREVSLVLLRDLPSLIPSVGWLFLFSVAGIFTVVWMFAMRRFARAPQGV